MTEPKPYSPAADAPRVPVVNHSVDHEVTPQSATSAPPIAGLMPDPIPDMSTLNAPRWRSKEQ
ncbi:hypothetical protein [Cellulosimicrobium sp. 22601]|uniref:hypothetical protein n=1 Tax=unclassified Cellulosimicrobium TaxID=2624466 RepID=UPI003F82414F